MCRTEQALWELYAPVDVNQQESMGGIPPGHRRIVHDVLRAVGAGIDAAHGSA